MPGYRLEGQGGECQRWPRLFPSTKIDRNSGTHPASGYQELLRQEVRLDTIKSRG
jgi:hypothetical protein